MKDVLNGENADVVENAVSWYSVRIFFANS